jgi:hypothetical protein
MNSFLVQDFKEAGIPLHGLIFIHWPEADEDERQNEPESQSNYGEEPSTN